MFSAMFPELHVTDCEAAAVFFERALGYRRDYTLVEEGQLDFAVMTHAEEGLKLMLHRMMPAGEAGKPRSVRLYYELDDIGSFCAELRGKGFAVTEPEVMEWGATTARLTGPDGYEIWFQQWND